MVEGHTRIEEVRNQVAIKRGPIVYCVETPDLPESANIVDIYLPSNADMTTEYKDDLLGGVTVIGADLLMRTNNNSSTMYKTVSKPDFEQISTQFIPYYAWSNRGTAEMSVFLPVIWK